MGDLPSISASVGRSDSNGTWLGGNCSAGTLMSVPMSCENHAAYLHVLAPASFRRFPLHLRRSTRHRLSPLSRPADCCLAADRGCPCSAGGGRGRGAWVSSDGAPGLKECRCAPPPSRSAVARSSHDDSGDPEPVLGPRSDPPPWCASGSNVIPPLLASIEKSKTRAMRTDPRYGDTSCPCSCAASECRGPPADQSRSNGPRQRVLPISGP